MEPGLGINHRHGGTRTRNRKNEPTEPLLSLSLSLSLSLTPLLGAGNLGRSLPCRVGNGGAVELLLGG
uniref:Uncharacterized protein n=1 Tax=Arundo donax TaxID=35708 RepID=A0A0A9E856_ARUDO